ncbi:MAG TPA: hypothetical protein VIE36_13840 [Methylomirabilota bacterium]
MRFSESVRSWIAYGIVGACVGATAVLAWRSRTWPLFHDAPVLHYVAWRIGAGDVPYRDLFEINAPGAYLIHLAAWWLGGLSDLTWRVYDLAWLALGAGAAFVFARAWGLVAATGAAAFLALYHLAGSPWEAGQRDFFLCPFLLAGGAGLARWAERDEPRALAVAGLAVGAAITIKPHVALLGALFAGVVVVRAGRQSARPLAVYAATMALPPLAIIGWLAAAGALGAWRELVVDFLVPVYTSLRPAARWELYRPEAWVPIVVGVLLSVATTIGRGAVSVRHVIAMLGVAYGVLHYVVQGKGWDYHLYPLVAFAAVMLFAELEPALAWRPFTLGGPLAASCLAAAALLGARGVDAVPGYFASAKVTHVRHVVGDLARITRPDDLVQILDTTEGGVHALLLLGLRQPTRFLCDFPLFAAPEAPITARYRAEFIAGFDARPPRAVVLFARGWPHGGPERVASFTALADRLARDYAIAVRRPGYTIYARTKV